MREHVERAVGILAIAAGLFLALGLFFPYSAQGQSATDSVRVTILGDLATATITVRDTTISIGDTIFYSAITVDSDGDPVPAQLTWNSSDPSAMEIDALTGVAVARSKAAQGVVISVLAQKIGDLLLASFRDGELQWEGEHELQEGEPLQFCAYLVDPAYFLLAEDPGPPICPTVFLPQPLPPNNVFASIFRATVRPLLDMR